MGWESINNFCIGCTFLLWQLATGHMALIFLNNVWGQHPQRKTCNGISFKKYACNFKKVARETFHTSEHSAQNTFSSILAFSYMRWPSLLGMGSQTFFQLRGRILTEYTGRQLRWSTCKQHRCNPAVHVYAFIKKTYLYTYIYICFSCMTAFFQKKCRQFNSASVAHRLLFIACSKIWGCIFTLM